MPTPAVPFPPSSAWEGTFYSSDGSGLKYVQDTSVSPAVYRLYMPDGSYYDFNSTREEHAWTTDVRRAAKLTDANGNFIQFNAPNVANGYPYGSWTDQLGRTFPIMVPLETPQLDASSQYITGPITDSFTLPGMSQPYVLTWKRLINAFSGSQSLRYVGGSNKTLDSLPYTPALFTSGNRLRDACGDTNSLLYIEGATLSGTSATDWHFNPLVLTQIDLPNGASYKFKYNEYGEIDRIEYPAGGHEEFTYGAVESLASMDPAYQQANRGVTVSKVFERDSDPIPSISTYSSEGSENNFRTSVIGPDGTQTDNFMHRGIPMRLCNQIDYPTYINSFDTRWGYDSPLAGKTYETRVFSSDNPKKLLQRTLTKWETSATSQIVRNYGPLYLQINARVFSTQSITYDGDPGVSAVTKFEYDTDKNTPGSPLNVIAKREYGYTVVSGGSGYMASTPTDLPPSSAVTLTDPTVGLTPARSTETTYETGTAYRNRNILKLPIQVLVKDGSGGIKAKSQMAYDGQSLLTDSMSGVPGWSDPGTNVRGLVTSVTTWHDIAANQSVTTQTQYNVHGSPRYSWDAKNNLTQTEYNDNFSDAINRNTYAFVKRVISPVPGGNGSTTSFETTIKYQYPTGLPVSTTDANNQITLFEYIDPLLRPTKVTAPNGHQTITEYGAGTSDTTCFVKTRSQIDASSWKEGYALYDGLGRTIKTQSVDDDKDVFVETKYDNAGRPSQTTNPYRNGDPILWTISTFDSAGRPWKVTTPDNAVVETLYSLSTSGDIGTVVTVKDQALKERRSITNAFGQLKRVDEPSGTLGLGTITSPYQPTTYGYDLLNNLASVSQIGDTTAECGGMSSCSQSRTFLYDAMSRLKSATNPESGTINYTYDANSNLQTKQDARGITTTYAYDTLNRVNTRSYSDGTTPQVSYFYDNLTNAKGKLIKVSSTVSTTEYTAFDTMGRVTAHKQTTDGTAYTTSYTYNLAGALIEETYPSGRVVKNVLDSSGDLAVVQSKKNAASGYWNYADSFGYNAAGAVTSMQLGNGKWESTVFNVRLQPTQIALGSTPGAFDKLKLEYTYGTNNNGNVVSQTITVPGMTYPLIQNYTYDSLNRIATATETSNSVQTWKQSFTYDRFGNRNFDRPNTTMPTSFTNPAITDPSISPNTNRITATGFLFDNAGNTTRDGAYQAFTYDAENKQVEVKNSSAVILGQYSYDGDGKRVKKYVPSSGETTIFVYDASGRSIAEYSTIVESVSTAKVNYLTNDHLGSPRINTDANGAVISRHDYHPFGEEIDGTGGRTVGLNYGSDTVRKQFTGYESDVETGLDFAQSRMYSRRSGRFFSADEPFADQSEDDPQSWNLFGYAGNNPLLFTDPYGKWKWSDPDQNGHRFVVWEKDDTWETLAKFLYDETGNYYTSETLADFYGAEGMVPLGEGLTLDFGHFDGKPVPGPHGIQDATMENLPINKGGGIVVKTGILQWLLRKLGIGAAEKSVEKVILKKAVAHVSKRNLRHIANRHLDEFRELDPSITLEKVVEIGQTIVAQGASFLARASNPTYQAAVNIGGRQVTVKVVLNSEGGIRSIYPLK